MTEIVKPSEKITVIRPASGWSPINFKELWSFRELLGFLVVRDIKVKYKQTFFGIAWAVLQPFVQMIVFTLFFGRLAKIDTEGIPYPVFSFTALLPWAYFSTALSFSSTSLVSNQHLVSKIYFPRLLLPASASVAALVDLAISMVLLIFIMARYSMFPTLQAFWVIPFIILAFVTALGCGMWLSAINVKYRDVQYTIPFMVQVWLFLTPVVYPASLVPEKFRILYGLNPMVAVIEGFRWATIPGKELPGATMMTVSIFVGIAIFITGAYYFKRMEKEFADVV